MTDEERGGALSFGDRGEGRGSVSVRPGVRALVKAVLSAKDPLEMRAWAMANSFTSAQHQPSILHHSLFYIITFSVLGVTTESVITDHSRSTPVRRLESRYQFSRWSAFGGSGLLAYLFDRFPVEMSASTRVVRSGPSQQVLRNYGTG